MSTPSPTASPTIPVEWIKIVVPAGTAIIDKLTSYLSGGHSRFTDETNISKLLENDSSETKLFFFTRNRIALCFVQRKPGGHNQFIDLGHICTEQTTFLFCSVALWYRDQL